MSQTRKNRDLLGGDISNEEALKHILSIGYELETSSLTKLTLTDTVDPDEEGVKSKSPDENELYGGEPVVKYMFNTDTARKDIEEFESVDFEVDEEDYNMLTRLEETIKEPIYKPGSKRSVDKDAIFYITNDLGDNRFNKKLLNECEDFSKEIPKNSLYRFRPLDKNEEYQIRFIYHNENIDCGAFANVEWLFTFFKPKRGKNIILDTFTRSIETLVDHLSRVEKIPGNFITKIHGVETVLTHPEKRNLYHIVSAKPGVRSPKREESNLYYLQTHIFKKLKGHDFDLEREIGLDDVCCTTQMTFSCKIPHVFSIMKALLNDTINSVPSIHEILERRLRFQVEVEQCSKKLVKLFIHKIKKTHNISTSSYETKKTLSIIYSYCGLIMYKLLVYYNLFLRVESSSRQYFKNYLSFNVRHANYDIYVHMKKHMAKLFSVEESDPLVVTMIRELFIQESVLMEFIHDKDVLRKGVFNSKNILDITSKHY